MTAPPQAPCTDLAMCGSCGRIQLTLEGIQPVLSQRVFEERTEQPQVGIDTSTLPMNRCVLYLQVYY